MKIRNYDKQKFLIKVGVSIILSVAVMVLFLIFLRYQNDPQTGGDVLVGYTCEQNCIITYDDDNNTEALYVTNQHTLLATYEEKSLNNKQIIYCCRKNE